MSKIKATKIDKEDKCLPPKVRLRGGFSERNNIAKENNIIQYTDFDERTRINLYNTILEILEVIRKYYEDKGLVKKYDSLTQYIIKQVFREVYVIQTDKDWYSVNHFFENYIFRTIKEDTYNAILDLIEYFFSEIKEYTRAENGFFLKRINIAFEYDFVGYRFVDGKIVAITDKNEIKEIEEAISSSDEKIKVHFRKALSYLADRDKKDYSNSIKESISAVECMCQILVKKPQTLSATLKLLEDKGIKINDTLQKAFKLIYGYTSSAGNIRHANAFSDEIPDFADAKYMLVACSAFVNYLKAKNAQITKD